MPTYPKHLSHSQVKSIDTCGEQFRLERGYGLRGPARWATVGGKGFHVATEYLDNAIASASTCREDDLIESPISRDTAGQGPGQVRESPLAHVTPERFPDPKPALIKSIEDVVAGLKAEQAECEVQMKDIAEVLRFEVPEESSEPSEATRELWQQGFNWSIAEELLMLNQKDLKAYERDGVEPSTVRPDPKDWLSSGRASKTWPDKENRDWWTATGSTMLSDFVRFRQTSGWKTAWWGDEPAIELDVSYEYEGIEIKAFLDRIELHPDFSIPTATVCDIKTNAKEPSDAEQLGRYATALEILGRPRPEWGVYYVARTGKMGKLHPLAQYSKEYFSWKDHLALNKRDNDGLVADTSNPFCRSCGVEDWCYAKNGKFASQIPLPWVEAAEKRKRLPLSIAS